MDFKNKVVLITGASSGIGKETAIVFAKLGANIILVARRKDKLEQVANELKEFHVSTLVCQCDISKTSGYRKISILIEQGLLIKSDYEFTSNNRKIDKYKSLFDNVKIDITNNKVTINVQFTQDIFSNSSILKTVYGA